MYQKDFVKMYYNSGQMACHTYLKFKPVVHSKYLLIVGTTNCTFTDPLFCSFPFASSAIEFPFISRVKFVTTRCPTNAGATSYLFNVHKDFNILELLLKNAEF